MAVDPKEGMYEHSGFSGLRNTVRPERFGLDDLEAATNVDIDDSKELHRRTGHGAAVVAGVDRCLWSNGSICLGVGSNALKLIHPDYTTTTLRTGLTPNLPLSYSLVGDRVFYSNGVDTGVVQNSVSRSWGLEIPTGQPVASATGGTLPAGRYQFAVTFLRNDGQESGTPPAGSIDLTVAGGIRLTSLPTTDDPDVSQRAVYFTKCNGETLYRVGLVITGTTSFDYQSEASMQVPLTTQHLRPAPAGQLVRSFGGWMLVACGNVLRYSEPYALELFDLRKGQVWLDEITLLEPTDDGVYVGTPSEVVWLEGDTPEKWALKPRLAYGAIPGAAVQMSRDMVLDGQGSGLVVVFATSQGVCLGDGSGQIANLTQDRFIYPFQQQGAALVRRHRGMVQAVVTLRGAETAAPAAL